MSRTTMLIWLKTGRWSSTAGTSGYVRHPTDCQTGAMYRHVRAASAVPHGVLGCGVSVARGPGQDARLDAELEQGVVLQRRRDWKAETLLDELSAQAVPDTPVLDDARGTDQVEGVFVVRTGK